MKNSKVRTSLAKKIFAYLILASLFPLGILGLTSYELSTNAIIQQAEGGAQKEVIFKRDILDLRLEQIENLLSDISGVQEIAEVVNQSTNTSDFTKLATRARIGYILNGYLSLNGLISIDIHTLRGQHYHVGETLFSSIVNESLVRRLLDEAAKDEGFIYWAGVEDNIYPNSQYEKVLTATNLFKSVNLQTLEQIPTAILVANYNLKIFSEPLVSQDPEDKSFFIVLDAKNRIIHHPDTSRIGRTFNRELNLATDTVNNIRTVQFDGEEMVVNEATFKRNKWKILRFEPLSAITGPADQIGIFTFSILFVCLLIVSVVTFRFSRTIVVPIQRVTNSFKAFETGNLDPNQQISVSGNDEISELSKWYNTFLDVVRQQTRVKASLVESENRFRDFADISSDWLWETDKYHNVTFVSDRFFEILKYPKEEVIGKSRLDVLDEADSSLDEISAKQHLSDLKEQKPFRISYPIKAMTGEIVHVETRGKPFFDEDGNFSGYRGSATDISKQVTSEDALRELNKSLEVSVGERTAELQSEMDRAKYLVAAIDALTESVAIYDSNEKLIFFNEQFSSFISNLSRPVELGATFEDVITVLAYENIFAATIGREEEWIADRMIRHENPPPPYEQELTENRWMLVHEQRLADGGTVILASDITDRKHLEEQVRRSQKMDAIGQLTGGIAHDFNNILGIISGNLELLEEELESEQLASLLNSAQKGVNRGVEITQKLLGFSRKDVGRIEPVILNNGIETIKELLVRSLTAIVNIETNLDDDLWPTPVNKGDFEDALLNLAINARDAMPDGGTFTVTTENKRVTPADSQELSNCPPGEYVCVSISDTGTGMDAATQQKIFDPFFTTKEQGKGTGLGLSMVYGFVNRSGGHIHLESSPGKGTTFCLLFPRSEDNFETKNNVEINSKDLPTGAETILVVDDENALREVAENYLQNLGYNTVSAENGDQALDILKQRSDIDLLFSDIVMPGSMNGYQLADIILNDNPHFPVLLTSGFIKTSLEQNELSSDNIQDVIDKVLRKPYNKMELANAIRNTLDLSK